MSKRRIGVGRVDIRLKGVSAESAHAAASDLGRELMSRLAAARKGLGGRRTGQVDHVDSGTVHLASGTTPSELRGSIAGSIVVSINSTRK